MIARHADVIHLIPRDHGLWVPAEARDGIRISRGLEVESIGLRLSRLPVHLSEATAVTVPASTLPLVRRLAHEDFPPESLPFIETVILDLLTPASTVLRMTLPTDPMLREFGERILETPVAPHPANHYAALAGITPATLSARFQRQTGLSWPQWLSRVRMYAAVLLLGQGIPVGEVAHRVHYSAPSRFSTAFGRLFGVTPKEFKSRTRSSSPPPLGEFTFSALATTIGRDPSSTATSGMRQDPRRATST